MAVATQAKIEVIQVAPGERFDLAFADEVLGEPIWGERYNEATEEYERVHKVTILRRAV